MKRMREDGNSGAGASGQGALTGAFAPDMRGGTPGSLCSDFKDVAKALHDELKPRLREHWVEDHNYDWGKEVAPDFGTGSKSQMSVDLGLQPGFPPGAEAPEMNSAEQPTRVVESTDSKPKEETIVKTGPHDSLPSKKGEAVSLLVGKTLGQTGTFLLQSLLEVLPLRSKLKGKYEKCSLFPLPTSREALEKVHPSMNFDEVSWFVCVCVSLNSLWGDVLFNDREANKCQRESLGYLGEQVQRFCKMTASIEQLDWTEFLKVKTVDYKGDEVRVARSFSWKNIAPVLPKEVGRVSLSEICTHGCKHYVDNFELYLKPVSEQRLGRAPRVMVEEGEWSTVCKGLVDSGVCGIIDEQDVYQVDGVPLLNGLFGVTKEDFTVDGTEIFRLIMNLIPLNQLCMSLGGDVATLPAWSSMSPFFLQPSENLLVSSEDVKCFFYVMSVPPSWVRYLAFNKPVPEDALPEEYRSQGRRFYLASLVLPMGFLNSVSLAQHVHRNLARFSVERLGKDHQDQGRPEHELRKDRSFPLGRNLWRIYLDNYDLLEKVRASGMGELEGSGAPGALALRQEYEHWEVPRNVKKSVQRSAKAEVQGATVDGVAGVAYPRESKLVKYFTLAFALMKQQSATQKQWQVVCGGLVYFTMFRRPLLGSLNSVWQHIESFNRVGAPYRQKIPGDCRLEVLRFLGALPLAALDFRLPMHPQVTCSDASMSGGGICASVAPTLLGSVISQGSLRGELAESRGDLSILVVGLFDGLGALRVAVDLLGVPVIGYVSVEKQAAARRVVESHFPDVVVFEDVKCLGATEIQSLAAKFSQAALVLIGAGPPCQGVSGLNCDRKGALKDERSSLFSEVPRIRDLFKEYFSWCPVFSLMESVASMDGSDRDVISQGFGGAPVHCDAGDISWCHRPRLYWCDWELRDSTGLSLQTQEAHQPLRLWLEGTQDIRQVIRQGWLKVEPLKRFPTFTTSRPRAFPGRKPAGISQCTQSDLARWKADSHRFPPYQYCEMHCLVNSRNELRIPDVAERECMLGFPVGYTSNCYGKNERKGDGYNDARLTLLGNTWSVPVVSCLLNVLFSRLGLAPSRTPQEIIEELTPSSAPTMQGRLFRLPLNTSRVRTEDSGHQLAFKLSNLVSIKGEDIMLNTSTSQQSKFHRLRATVPAKCWHWKIVTGWKWTQGKEHINAYELRAILTSLRWRLEHQLHLRTRLLHLTDSMVCLHSLCRGRSSSRKLRRTMSRINALTLAGGVHPFWGYIHTDQNPADKPSRWASRVKTKFKNAKK